MCCIRFSVCYLLWPKRFLSLIHSLSLPQFRFWTDVAGVTRIIINFNQFDWIVRLYLAVKWHFNLAQSSSSAWAARKYFNHNDGSPILIISKTQTVIKLTVCQGMIVVAPESHSHCVLLIQSVIEYRWHFEEISLNRNRFCMKRSHTVSLSSLSLTLNHPYNMVVGYHFLFQNEIKIHQLRFSMKIENESAHRTVVV